MRPEEGENVERERKGRTEGCLEREEVVVSSKAGHMPDRRLRRKNIALFVSIVPPFAETPKKGVGEYCTTTTNWDCHRHQGVRQPDFFPNVIGHQGVRH